MVLALASYPRCGNTRLRLLVEALTGRPTGSDAPRKAKLVRDLEQGGFVEGEVEDVLGVKTHAPERAGLPMEARSAVVVTRPFGDAVESFFHMALTRAHNETVHEACLAVDGDALRELFERFAAEEVRAFDAFHRFWLDRPRIPTLVLTFAQVTAPEPVVALTQLRMFVARVAPEAPLRSVEDALCALEARTAPYAPRSKSSAARFSAGLVEHTGPSQAQTLSFPAAHGWTQAEVAPVCWPAVGDGVELSQELGQFLERNKAMASLRKSVPRPLCVVASNGEARMINPNGEYTELALMEAANVYFVAAGVRVHVEPSSSDAPVA